MATGPEHYMAAEKLLEKARKVDPACDNELPLMWMASVHASLALAAATAMHPASFDRWYDVAGPK